MSNDSIKESKYNSNTTDSFLDFNLNNHLIQGKLIQEHYLDQLDSLRKTPVSRFTKTEYRDKYNQLAKEVILWYSSYFERHIKYYHLEILQLDKALTTRTEELNRRERAIQAREVDLDSLLINKKKKDIVLKELLSYTNSFNFNFNVKRNSKPSIYTFTRFNSGGSITLIENKDNKFKSNASNRC